MVVVVGQKKPRQRIHQPLPLFYPMLSSNQFRQDSCLLLIFTRPGKYIISSLHKIKLLSKTSPKNIKYLLAD
jgi:hypothetical protein